MHRDRHSADRRILVIGGGSCLVAGTLGANLARSQDGKPAPPDAADWREAIRKVTGSATVTEGRIALEVPEIAENGNVVPFVATVDSPMTATSFVRSLRLFATGNPQALIATFRFSPDSGRAMVSSRMRLAKSQDVIALAELDDGTFLSVKRNIKVTIGGCGG